MIIYIEQNIELTKLWHCKSIASMIIMFIKFELILVGHVTAVIL